MERSVGYRQCRHLGTVEVLEHIPYVAKEGAADLRQPRAVSWFTEKQIRAQLLFDVTDMPRYGGCSSPEAQ
jgi:hypothetical protein